MINTHNGAQRVDFSYNRHSHIVDPTTPATPLHVWRPLQVLTLHFLPEKISVLVLDETDMFGVPCRLLRCISTGEDSVLVLDEWDIFVYSPNAKDISSRSSSIESIEYPDKFKKSATSDAFLATHLAVISSEK